jgi:hypothetical protein
MEKTIMIGLSLYEKHSTPVQKVLEEYRNRLEEIVDRSIGYDAGSVEEIHDDLLNGKQAPIWQYVLDNHMEWLDEIDHEVVTEWSLRRNEIAEHYSLVYDGKHNTDIAYESTLVEFGEDYLKVLEQFPHFNDDVEAIT